MAAHQRNVVSAEAFREVLDQPAEHQNGLATPASVASVSTCRTCGSATPERMAMAWRLEMSGCGRYLLAEPARRRLAI
jgi:hypothetical protein